MPRHATRTSFQKGQVGNPKGRPKEFPEFREACRERTPKALEVIDAALKEKSTPLAMEASKTVLAYAWGKPPTTLTGEGGEGDVKLTVDLSETARALLGEIVKGLGAKAKK